MSVGVTTTTQIDNAVRKFVAKALEAREHEGVMARVTDQKVLPRKMGSTYYEPYFNSLTSAQLTDGVELDSPQHLLDGEITIVPSEYGVQVAISHWSDDIVSEDLFGVAGRLMSRANEYKRDTTGLAQLDNFSKSMGSGTNALTMDYITAGAAYIRAGRGSNRSNGRTTGDPGPEPINAVIHEFQWYDLAAQMSGMGGTGQVTTTGLNFDYGANSISPYQVKWIETHFRGKFHNVNVLIDNNLTIGSDAAKGGVFSKEALINLKFRGLKRKVAESDDGRVTKITLVDNWGWGERNDGWGAELNCDAISPTG